MKYTLGLAKAAQRRGVNIYPQSAVVAWEKQGSSHLLRTSDGILKADHVIVATNGYTEDSLHSSFRYRLLPVLSNIITTRPLTIAEREAQGWQTKTPVYDTRKLLFYYRLLPDGRFLLGGRGGTVGSVLERDRWQQWMQRRLGEMFPAWKDVEITHFWNGLVCLSPRLTPHVGSLAEDPSVFYALAYHGSGVAGGTWSGRAIARLVAGQQTVEDLCAVFRQPLQRFPLPQLRIWSLRAAYFLANWLD
jgi:glycine/D-amino acid oxidase-like deaminating enzyme